MPASPPISPLDPISPWPPLPPPAIPAPKDTNPPGVDTSPNAKEVYALIAVLGTYLLFGIYILWTFAPAGWLDALGWTWYPAQEWGIIGPCWLMILVLLAYWTYAALTAYRTPSFDSLELITDRYCGIPQHEAAEPYYHKYAKEEHGAEAVDLPIDLVNRVFDNMTFVSLHFLSCYMLDTRGHSQKKSTELEAVDFPKSSRARQ